MLKELKRKDVNDLHTELGQPAGDITWVTVKAMSLQLSVMFKPCKVYALAKLKCPDQARWLQNAEQLKACGSSF